MLKGDSNENLQNMYRNGTGIVMHFLQFFCYHKEYSEVVVSTKAGTFNDWKTVNRQCVRCNYAWQLTKPCAPYRTILGDIVQEENLEKV